MLDRTFIDLTAAELAVVLGGDRRFADSLLDWLRRKGHAQRIGYTITRRGERLVQASIAAGMGATSVVEEKSASKSSSSDELPERIIAPKGGRPPVLWRIPRTIVIDLLEQAPKKTPYYRKPEE